MGFLCSVTIQFEITVITLLIPVTLLLLPHANGMREHVGSHVQGGLGVAAIFTLRSASRSHRGSEFSNLWKHEHFPLTQEIQKKNSKWQFIFYHPTKKLAGSVKTTRGRRTCGLLSWIQLKADFEMLGVSCRRLISVGLLCFQWAGWSQMYDSLAAPDQTIVKTFQNSQAQLFKAAALLFHSTCQVYSLVQRITLSTSTFH